MTVTEQFKTDIYNNYYSKVLGYLKSQVNNTETAEDIASDVFIKVYEKLDSFDESKASLSTWIFTITRNKLTDFYRTRRVFSEVPETYAEPTSLEDDVCNEAELETLADALESIDGRERDIIVFRYYSGMTLKDIAQRMNISYAYVKVLHNRALSNLRKYF